MMNSAQPHAKEMIKDILFVPTLTFESLYNMNPLVPITFLVL